MKRRYTRPRFFYHITQSLKLISINGDRRVILKPIGSGDKLAANRGFDEPSIRRICVAPSVSGCMTALDELLDNSKCIFVYRTAKKVVGIYPWKVYDSEITCEKWLTRQTRFELVGVVYSKVHTSIVQATCEIIDSGQLMQLRLRKREYKKLLGKYGLDKPRYFKEAF